MHNTTDLEARIDYLTNEIRELKEIMLNVQRDSGKINYDNIAELAVINFVVFKALDSYLGGGTVLNNIFGG